MAVEYLVRDSDNQILLTLTEDDVAVTGFWNAIDIYINDTLYIHRTANQDGISFNSSTGVLSINPGDLTALEKTALEALTRNELYRAQIVMTTPANDDGAVFGGPGSDPLYFHIGDNPL